MSRIYVVNWLSGISRGYWRRFAASVTGLGRRYRTNPFFRTEINIFGLQVAYALAILALAIGGIYALYRNLLDGIGEALAAALADPATVSPATVLQQLQAMRTHEVAGIAFLLVCAALVFGYLVARLALTPARNALETQKRFIGNVAHELRTPLSVIKTNLEVQLLVSTLPKEIRAMYRENLLELDRISEIIDNLLTLNTLIAPGQMPFRIVDVERATLDMAKKLKPLVQDKPVRVRVDAPRERHAWGNPAAIEQIMMNLLKNALVHTREGTVEVSMQADGAHWLAVQVSDTGSGIHQEDLPHIFEPFYRGNRARTRQAGSSGGLGLTIVNELVKLHRGHIEVHSVPRRGTKVTVTLPLAAPAVVPAMAPVPVPDAPAGVPARPEPLRWP